MKCAKCGREVKHLYYFEGIGYGSECFKSVAGIGYDEYISNERIEKIKQSEEDFLLNNPITYICIDKDSYNLKEELKANKYQFSYGYWIGFKPVENIELIECDTKTYWNGWKGNSDNLYGFDISILDVIMGKEEYIGEEKEKVNLENIELVNINTICGYYGDTYSYEFKKDNYKLIWNTAKDLELEVNTVIRIKGTIKENRKCQEGYYTYLTRCKIV